MFVAIYFCWIYNILGLKEAVNLELYSILKDLAFIIVFSKVFGILARKVKIPQVAGEILAGIVIGPSLLGIVQISDYIKIFAEIGVVLLMFSAGIETNIEDIKKTGFKAFLIALCGVFIPLGCGYLLYSAFYGFAPLGDEKFLSAIFIGVILTATSVSITAQTLKELGKIKTEVGTTIMSAAIIDDVIGIIVLTFVIGMKDSDTKPSSVIFKTVLFFVFAFVVGEIIYRVFKFINKRWPHTRRISIFSLVFCFAMAYVAEKFFGIADITGAFVAGVILSNLKDASYIETKLDTNSYMIFGPVFFASIGLKTDIRGIDSKILLFTLAFVLVALISKIVGCSGISKLLKFSWNDSLKIGVGMMTRGEVALIVAQKGFDAGLLSPKFFTCVIILIIISSVITPIFLKLIYEKDKNKEIKAEV